MRMYSIFGGSNSNEYNNEEGIDTASTQELASRSIPEPLQSLDGSDIDTNVNDDNDHDRGDLRNDLPHFPTPRSLSSGESGSDTSYVHKKRKPRKHINLDTQHLESRHTIQQHKNLLKSIETEFNADLTGHIWSTVLIKQKEREREERRRRRGLSECSANDSHDEEVRPPPPKRRRGRPKLSGPDHTSDKIITRVWTSWPLPYGRLPPISPSTTVVSATSNTSEPHPLEEAITALFLRQAAQTLRAKNLPVSSDDTVSNHMLRPIIGGILSRLDRLLLAVHETNNSDLRGQSGKNRLYRKVPMGWSGVLGLAGLSGWDEGWGGDGAIAENQTSDTITSMATLGPVGRATQRMCAATGEQMNWRTWSVSSGNMTISNSFTFPIQHPSKPTTTSSEDQSIQVPYHAKNDTRLPYYGTSSFDLYSGVHRDGFLELIPTSAEQKKRNEQNMTLRFEKNLNFNHTTRRHDDHLNNATNDDSTQNDKNDEGEEGLEEIIDSNIGISNVGSESGEEDADSDE